MEIFLKMENLTVQKKMDEALKQLYEQSVPEPVRKYLDAKTGTKTKRPSRSGVSKSASASKKEKEEPLDGRS